MTRRKEVLKLLERYSKRSLSDGRLPSIEECVQAIEYPQKAGPLIKEYLKQRPELEKRLRKILGVK